ncbi:hypothetical protein PR048_013196 [Dryococelus australis]|uniref:Uncharacterized protein n=1 Tax=Dryococelus australis TaxID=614101 RepID=A0ABQ9HRF7_9NEOP|nr:hypothetical protein PR048_013196 [Dryococelus australis]
MGSSVPIWVIIPPQSVCTDIGAGGRMEEWEQREACNYNNFNLSAGPWVCDTHSVRILITRGAGVGTTRLAALDSFSWDLKIMLSGRSHLSQTYYHRDDEKLLKEDLWGIPSKLPEVLEQQDKNYQMDDINNKPVCQCLQHAALDGDKSTDDDVPRQSSKRQRSSRCILSSDESGSADEEEFPPAYFLGKRNCFSRAVELVHPLSQPAKYAIKVMGLADAHNAYLFNAYVYCGKGCDGATLCDRKLKLQIITQAVIHLAMCIFGTNRNITLDNCYNYLKQRLTIPNLPDDMRKIILDVTEEAAKVSGQENQLRRPENQTIIISCKREFHYLRID